MAPSADPREKSSLSQLLQSLPLPKHTYEITADQVMRMEEEIQGQEQAIWDQDHLRQKAEDQEDLETRMRAERERLELLEKARQSSVVKQGLPRPNVINQRFFRQELENPTADMAHKLIVEEVQAMLINDNHKYPAKGMKEIKKAPFFQEIAPEYLDHAR